MQRLNEIPYEYISRELLEIGKIVGGWQKVPNESDTSIKVSQAGKTCILPGLQDGYQLVRVVTFLEYRTG